MLTISVCDDNVAFSGRLVDKIRQLCITELPERIEFCVTDGFASADAVLDYLKFHTIDILFLDIDMPGLNGFDLAAVLNERYLGMIIIFISSYDDFVYSSFEYSPFRFLRKSRLEEELPGIFAKAVEKCIISNETMLFSATDGDKVLRLRDIYYFEGQKNYYLIHQTNREILRCRGTISRVESETARIGFVKIHAAYVVNMENIEKTVGANAVLMKDGAVLSISQGRMKQFKKTYMSFIRKRIED